LLAKNIATSLPYDVFGKIYLFVVLSNTDW